jgi:hypothetical protein
MLNTSSFDRHMAPAQRTRRAPHRRASDAFNDSGFSRFINSGAGRVFRVVAGLGFLALGVRFRDRGVGKAALAWSVFPLSAGGLDLCFISAALGGPLSGATIREAQRGVLASGA